MSIDKFAKASFLILVIGLLNVWAQKVAEDNVHTFKLAAVFDHSTEPPTSQYGRNVACVDLVTLTMRCRMANGIIYGERYGVNWDILQVVGPQTRMIEIGKFELDDVFEIPHIEPWARLNPGELRSLHFNASGSDGEHGLNGDGSKQELPRREGGANKPVKYQVSSRIVRPDGTVLDDDYKPSVQINRGYVYAVRVFDQENDQYLLLRIDELERGKRAIISIKRVEGPSR
ncbi:MAG TPA: hypothetical protein PKD24_07760 [Pyrinomonadaceae bacterium]|nr:hypothetical protein [Pyrinomonadaceae bacterium]